MIDMKLFSLRRAVERLRDGLFDSTAIDRLTMESEPVIKQFSKGLGALEKGRPAHLCICGSYGQGKSHNLNYLHAQALAQGYAASLVQLDIREIPFHQFPIVYQALLERLCLPDGRTFIEAWKQFAAEGVPEELLNSMPHRFRMILWAMISKSKPASKKQNSPKSPILRPKEIAASLERAFMGREISLFRLKQILKSCGVEGYQKEPLACKGNNPYILMIHALGGLLRKMGYKGLVLFFDEAEAIAQGRVGSRVKSYDILHQLFNNKQPVYPIFAFTESFFDRVRLEDYTSEKPIFPQNYAALWEGLTVVRLEENSHKEWEGLQDRLIQLYAEAYRLDLSAQIVPIKRRLQSLLDQIKTQETRFKIKALVQQLDIETQNYFLVSAHEFKNLAHSS